MSSLQSRIKQLPANAGYYITIADISGAIFTNLGTDEVPNMNNAAMKSILTASGALSIVSAAGGVLRDMGKTIVAPLTQRTFRKVQVLINKPATEGVGGVEPGYLTGYIELPGTGGMSSGSGSYTAVARLG